MTTAITFRQGIVVAVPDRHVEGRDVQIGSEDPVLRLWKR